MLYQVRLLRALPLFVLGVIGISLGLYGLAYKEIIPANIDGEDPCFSTSTSSPGLGWTWLIIGGLSLVAGIILLVTQPRWMREGTGGERALQRQIAARSEQIEPGRDDLLVKYPSTRDFWLSLPKYLVCGYAFSGMVWLCRQRMVDRPSGQWEIWENELFGLHPWGGRSHYHKTTEARPVRFQKGFGQESQAKLLGVLVLGDGLEPISEEQLEELVALLPDDL